MKKIEDVLYSETRKDILKLLAEKNHRSVDLSNALKKDRSTITEHLAILKNAGFVERIERKGYKWVFYTLSQNAYAYFPNRIKHTVLFVLATLALVGSIISFMAYLPVSIFAPQHLGGDYIKSDFVEDVATKRALTIEQEHFAQNYTPTQEVETTEEKTLIKENELYIYVSALLFALFMLFAILFALTKKTKFVILKQKKS